MCVKPNHTSCQDKWPVNLVVQTVLLQISLHICVKLCNYRQPNCHLSGANSVIQVSENSRQRLAKSHFMSRHWLLNLVVNLVFFLLSPLSSKEQTKTFKSCYLSVTCAKQRHRNSSEPTMQNLPLHSSLIILKFLVKNQFWLKVDHRNVESSETYLSYLCITKLKKSNVFIKVFQKYDTCQD